MDPFRLDDDALRQIMQLLEQEMDIGLSPATHRTADVKMFPTYVRNIADGTETGQIMALDLGGTNFRVILVNLLPHAKVELTSKNFVIPQSIMLGEGGNVSDTSSERVSRATIRFSSFSGILPIVCWIS